MSLLLIILVLLSILILLLAIPVHIVFRIRGIDNFTKDFMICWLFGLLRIRVPLRIASAGKSSEHTDDSLRKRSWYKAVSQDKSEKSLTGLPRKYLLRLAKDLLHTIHFRELELQMRLGLGDPADTGRLWAWVGPLSATMQAVRHWRINIEPDFMNTVVDFKLHGRVVFIPLRIVIVLAAFLLSASGLSYLRYMGRF